MEKVRKVTTTNYEPAVSRKQEKGVKKVAAYCRVSTLFEEQDMSYKTQYDYYNRLIESCQDMELIEVYGDKGISGLHKDNRPEFLRMLKDCEEGKIDVVMTKSISRFSRNMSECMEAVNRLKELGIEVIFEKEKINSSDPNSELFFNILSALAQEESNSISMNIKWSNDRRNSEGKPSRVCGYGYRKKPDDKSQWVIYEPEAKRVRLAFNMAYEGHTNQEIVDALNEFERSEGTEFIWKRHQIYNLFRNEIYKGDILTPKHVKLDYKSGKVIRNQGEREQYLIEEHHEAIVPREVFDTVLEYVKARKLRSKDKRSKGK